LKDSCESDLALLNHGIISFMEAHQPRIQIQEEMLLAKQSRMEGNEGRARVCARRAAGTAVQLFLEKRGLSQGDENALQSLIDFGKLVRLPERIQAAVNWLIHRVDQDNNLPPEIDLIEEAGVVLRYLDQQDSAASGMH
jgi:hypothetical protein